MARIVCVGIACLVAPALQPGGWATLSLPEGGWYDYFSD
jgi:hypothetical protein